MALDPQDKEIIKEAVDEGLHDFFEKAIVRETVEECLLEFFRTDKGKALIKDSVERGIRAALEETT